MGVLLIDKSLLSDGLANHRINRVRSQSANLSMVRDAVILDAVLGTFPVNDTTMRIDYGDSLRSDSHTRIFRLAGELGDADVKLKVSTGCIRGIAECLFLKHKKL